MNPPGRNASDVFVQASQVLRLQNETVWVQIGLKRGHVALEQQVLGNPMVGVGGGVGGSVRRRGRFMAGVLVVVSFVVNVGKVVSGLGWRWLSRGRGVSMQEGFGGARVRLHALLM